MNRSKSLRRKYLNHFFAINKEKDVLYKNHLKILYYSLVYLTYGVTTCGGGYELEETGHNAKENY